MCFVCSRPLPKPRLYGITCSKECHEELVRLLEEEFGKYKKVVDTVTGLAHRVPTREIIERGLKHAELRKYPVWSE